MRWMKLASTLLALGCFALPAMAEQDVFTTDKGEVYLYGNAALASPHALILDGSTVTLNGIPVFPKASDTASSSVVVPTSSPRDPIYAGGWERKRQLERDGESISDITNALAGYYREQAAYVDSVSGIQEGSFWVWWKGEDQPEQIMVTCSANRPTPEQLARGAFDLYKALLERDCLIVISSGGNFYVPPNDQERLQTVRAEIARARSMPPTDREHFAAAWQTPGGSNFIAAAIAWQFTNPIPLDAVREK